MPSSFMVGVGGLYFFYPVYLSVYDSCANFSRPLCPNVCTVRRPRVFKDGRLNAPGLVPRFLRVRAEFALMCARR